VLGSWFVVCEGFGFGEQADHGFGSEAEDALVGRVWIRVRSEIGPFDLVYVPEVYVGIPPEGGFVG
jgi:hypothetical protein